VIFDYDNIFNAINESKKILYCNIPGQQYIVFQYPNPFNNIVLFSKSVNNFPNPANNILFFTTIYCHKYCCFLKPSNNTLRCLWCTFARKNKARDVHENVPLLQRGTKSDNRRHSDRKEKDQIVISADRTKLWSKNVPIASKTSPISDETALTGKIQTQPSDNMWLGTKSSHLSIVRQ
jgi:hypothetical protein